MATTTLLPIVLILLSAAAPSAAKRQQSLIATVLSTFGFEELAAATAAANFSAGTPTTIFAPTSSSLRTCASCSLPLVLQEHTLPGLYSLHFLRSLAFGTKIATFAPNRCLTVTSSSADPNSAQKVFINGAEITKPELFNNGFVVIHGLQGFISHLSPVSCRIERMTSLSFTHPQKRLPAPALFVMRQMLKDSMMRLRTSGYSIAAMGMRVMYADLSNLKSLTFFAVDDDSIFTGGEGRSYAGKLRFHVVPNRLLMATELMALPKGAALPTMESGRNLTVTSIGGGGPLGSMRLNYVRVKEFDMVYNERIAIHGLSMTFRPI